MTSKSEGTMLFRNVDKFRRDVALYKTLDLFQYRSVSLKYLVVMEIKVS
jgi:hypothetical protein